MGCPECGLAGFLVVLVAMVLMHFEDGGGHTEAALGFDEEAGGSVVRDFMKSGTRIRNGAREIPRRELDVELKIRTGLAHVNPHRSAFGGERVTPKVVSNG